MTKIANQLKSQWDNLVLSIHTSAGSIEYLQYPELAARVRRDAEQFTSLAPPETAEEWNQRRTTAARMRKQWSVQLSDIRTGRVEPSRAFMVA